MASQESVSKKRMRFASYCNKIVHQELNFNEASSIPEPSLARHGQIKYVAAAARVLIKSVK